MSSGGGRRVGGGLLGLYAWMHTICAPIQHVSAYITGRMPKKKGGCRGYESADKGENAAVYNQRAAEQRSADKRTHLRNFHSRISPPFATLIQLARDQTLKTPGRNPASLAELVMRTHTHPVSPKAPDADPRIPTSQRDGRFVCRPSCDVLGRFGRHARPPGVYSSVLQGELRIYVFKDDQGRRCNV